MKDRDLEGIDLSCWRIAGCGAEPVRAATLNAFAERFAPVGFRPTSFFPCYGLAEHVLAAAVPPRDRALRVQRRAAEVVSCGRALPGHEIKILRPDGSEAESGEVGEIALAGASVMLGYYHDAAATSDAIRNGWLHTGDLGYIAEGELFVCGRVKELIVANGRKYHPQDLEWAIDEPGPRRVRAVAFGAADSDGRDRVVVVVEAADAVADGLAAVIRSRIAAAFGLYVDEVVPVPVGSIPRTTSGKVRRAAVRAEYESRHAAGSAGGGR
jgi:fatty-acyl-CoA synthase